MELEARDRRIELSSYLSLVASYLSTL